MNNKVQKWLADNKIRALGFSVLMLVITYAVSNLNLSFTGDPNVLSKVDRLKRTVIGNGDTNDVPDSVLLVNIAYDKELVTVYDDDGFELGQIDITNRHRLYEFLKAAKDADNYKYILVDVFFDRNYVSDCDDELYGLIASMPRIIVSNHTDGELAGGEALRRKSGTSEYITTFFSDKFYKYKYISRSDTSLVMKMYMDVSGHRISKAGPLYFDKGRLMNSRLFARQDIIVNEPYNDDGEKNYYNLSTDILIDTAAIPDLIDGKYVVIADMVLNDQHDTVQGRVAGGIITYNMFEALMKGRHLVSVPYVVFLLIFYWIIGYLIITGKSLYSYIDKLVPRGKSLRNNTFIKILLSFIGYSTILSIVSVVTFYWIHVVYDIFIISLVIQAFDFHKTVIRSKE